MENTQDVVRDILEAINSVRSRARAAHAKQDHQLYAQLVGDLTALEVLLVGETTKLIDELDKKIA